jgi:7,8-dihydro-6-hydroxymethylpterin-pyrophosphokinase
MIDGDPIDTQAYRVPHPELWNRRFVLEPLLELEPPDRERLEGALEAIGDQRVTRFGDL